MFETLGLLGLFIGVFLSGSIFPFSSDALYVAALLSGKFPLTATLAVAIIGNWMGALATYFMGMLAKWEWLERKFNITREKLEKQKKSIDRYGVWLALFCWIPIAGQAVLLALGFYRSKPLLANIFIFLGIAVRFVIWTAVLS